MNWKLVVPNSSSSKLKVEMDYLFFLRLIRNLFFPLHVLFLSKILPWIFSFGRIYHARWLIIHHDYTEILLKS